MIKAAILDDEIKGSTLLNHKLKEFGDRLQVVAIYNDPQIALQELKELGIDVLFLDIEMPKWNGFEVIAKLGTFEFEVIFVTAYNAFVLDALRSGALDYLLKPVDPNELTKAVEKLELKCKMRANRVVHSPRETGRLSLSTAEGIYYIKKEELIKVEAMSNYSIFNLTGDKKIVVSKTLKDFEAVLTTPQFLRVNRGTIVNLSYISKYRKGDGGVLDLVNGEEVEVSSSKKTILLECLERL